MKVLYLHNYFHIKSGSNVIMFEEAELLKKNGHEVFYFCTDKKPYYDENYQYLHLFPKFKSFGDLSFIEKLLNIHRPFYNPEAIEKFRQMLDEVKPDVVHDHTITYYLTPFILLECYKRNIPVVSTIHSGSPNPLPGGKQNILKNSLKKLSPFNLYRKLIFAVYKHFGFYSRASRIVFPSYALAKAYNPFNIPEEKITVIHNFIKTIPNPDQVQSQGNFFLFAGRLVLVKGIYELINAWKSVPEEIELHIVGTGEEEANLKRIVNENNLKNVKFLGFLEAEKLDEQYKNCIASILPSIWLEAFGLTILESYNYSKPVIASNVGGIKEIIDHNTNGMLVEPYDVEGIADAAKYLYYNQEVAAKMGKKGREKLENEFSPEKHYEKLIGLYENLIHK